MIGPQSHAVYLGIGLLVASLAACTTHGYSIETRDQIISTASPKCIERAISARYVTIEARTDDLPNGKARHVFFDLAKGEFDLDPAMRNYYLELRPFGASKLALAMGWSKRGNPITAMERRQVGHTLEQIYASLSDQCGLPKAKLELIVT